MIKVLIADDHAVIRRGLKQLLDAEADMKEADEARNAHEALNLASKKQHDVLLLDIDMPGRSGLEALKALKVQRPDLPVLVLSFHHEEQFATRVLKAGAAGYLTKENAPEELVKAIRQVYGGRKYISSSMGEKLSTHRTSLNNRGGQKSQL